VGDLELRNISVLNFREWAVEEFGLEGLPEMQKLIVLDYLVATKRQELSHLRNSNEVQKLEEVRDLHVLYQKMFKNNMIEILNRQILIALSTIVVVLVCFLYWGPRRKSNRFSLVFGLPKDRSLRKNIGDLTEFFLEERIPIRKSTTIIIENNKFNFLPQKLNHLKLVSRAELFLISRMGLFERLNVVSLCLHNFSLMFRRTSLASALRISFRQFLLEIPVSTVVVRENMLDWVATTNSDYLRQHSVFYLASKTSLPTYMFWYSENSFPKLFGQNFDAFDYEQFRNISVKEHFVWTQDFADFLKNYSVSKITCVGSILFYPRPERIESTKDIDVLIFDVTPFATATKRDFYNYERCTGFLDALLNFQQRLLGREIRVALKPKRTFSSIHDSRYLFNLVNIESKPHNWDLVNPTANLYSLISRARLVVGIPFTSAVLIARELGVQSCYFLDCDDDELPEFFNGVPVIRNLDDLEDLFLKC
jgi:polysaccharide biosynthesis PFTS motif protein